MKRFIVILLALSLLFVSASAEDLAALSVDQLRELVRLANAEIVSRQEWTGTDVPAGQWVVGEDIPAGNYSISLVDGEGAYLRIRDASGWLVTSGGVRSEKDAIGKISLSAGFVVEIEDGVLRFGPAKALVF